MGRTPIAEGKEEGLEQQILPDSLPQWVIPSDPAQPPQGPQVMGLHHGNERLQVPQSPGPYQGATLFSPTRKAHVSEGGVVIEKSLNLLKK